MNSFENINIRCYSRISVISADLWLCVVCWTRSCDGDILGGGSKLDINHGGAAGLEGEADDQVHGGHDAG